MRMILKEYRIIKNEAHYKNPFVIDILPELDDNLKKDNQICYIRFYVKDCN